MGSRLQVLGYGKNTNAFLPKPTTQHLELDAIFPLHFKTVNCPNCQLNLTPISS